jgi:uncharacterized membrane protein
MAGAPANTMSSAKMSRMMRRLYGPHPRRANVLHRVFALGIWVKGIDGVLEIIGGVVFLLTSNAALNRLVTTLTQHELVEDPHDWIANAARQTTAQLSASTKLFGGVYLIAHGLAKVVLVVGLLRGKSWAYPVAIAFLGLFIAYQCYRLSYQFSLGLLLLTLFDGVIVALIWREYRSLNHAQNPLRGAPPGPP